MSEELKQLSVMVPLALVRDIDAAASNEDRSRASWIRCVIRRALSSKASS